MRLESCALKENILRDAWLAYIFITGAQIR